MKPLVIFDWDGVIADSCPAFFDYYRQTAEHYQKPFPLKSLDEFRAWYDSAWEGNFLKMGFTADEVPAVIAYQAGLISYERIPVFPGMKEILETLAGRCTLAIASTTHSRHIREKARTEGFEEVFSFFCGGEGGTSDKRSRISRVLDHFKVSGPSALMIGDTVMDIVSAKALGLKSIGVCYGWNMEETVQNAAPDYLIRKREEFIPLLSRILTAGKSNDFFSDSLLPNRG